ncbi:hypothetical protein Tco_1486110, partial [Tanacetum coccineum]
MSLFYKLQLIRNKPADEEGSGSSLCVSFVRGVDNDSLIYNLGRVIILAQHFFKSCPLDFMCVLLDCHTGTMMLTGVGVIVIVYGVGAGERLFEVRAPLVQEFMLKFFRTCRMSDTEMGLDVADTLCFHLGETRRRMTWRQFILALGLHSEEEMAEARFGAYWLGSEKVIPNKGDLRDYWMGISFDGDLLGPAPSYVHIRDPVRRLCHRMIACSISGRGQGAEKVTRVYLFYLRIMDRGTANVPYLL